MILQTAVNYLAQFVASGSCTSAPNVIPAIAEAQRRIYHLGDWIGLIRRWAVTVDGNGEFSTPTECDTVQRISELSSGLSHSNAGTLITMDANAFIFDTPSVLAVEQIEPRRYRILGPFPKAVDVMGKVAIKDPTKLTDSMTVDDLDALKMLVLAIFREENNAPEYADKLISGAVSHLTSKTNLAIESARASSWQSKLATATPGTRGYARVKAAFALNGGSRKDDAMISSLVDDAEKRLMDKVAITSTYLFKAIGGYISCPREIKSVVRMDINNTPTHINGLGFEFMENGMGFNEATYRTNQVNYRGEFALQADMPGRSKLTIVTLGSNRGIRICITGKLGNDTISETVTTNGGDIVTTSLEYDDVTQITAPPRDGPISFIAGDTEVANIQAYETSSTVVRYSIPSGNECTPQIVRVIALPRWIPKIRDEQRMQVDNEQAITMMAAAIQLERAGKFQEAAVMADSSVKLLESDLSLKNMGHAIKLDKARNGMSLRRLNTGK